MKKLTVKQLLCFGIGAFGIDLSYGLVNSYFFKYYNTRLGVSATFITIVMVLCRIWDGINDPMMGTIVDNTKTKYGKFRPWIMMGVTLNAVVLVFMFINPAFLGITGKTGLYIYLAVLYLLWGMTYTMVDIPYWSMIPTLTNDSAQRNIVSAVPRFFSGLAQFIIAGATLIAVNYLGGYNSGENAGDLSVAQQKGYPIWAAILAFFFILGLYITCFTTKERIISPKTDSFSLVRTFRIVKSNDQLIAFILTAFTFNTGWYLMSALGTYFFEIVAGREILVTYFAAICGFGQVMGLLIMPKISGKFGKKKVIQTAFSLTITGDIIMLLLSFVYLKIDPLSNAGYYMFIPFAIFAFISCIGIGMSFTCQTVMLADIVDYGEYKLGKRTDSTVFSMKSFLLKFALTAQVAITGIGLSISKTDVVYKKLSGSSIENFAPYFSDSQKITVSMMMFAIPPVLAVIALIIFNKKYKLYGELEKKVNEFVRAKHACDFMVSADSANVKKIDKD